jgi:hypothetical protein
MSERKPQTSSRVPTATKAVRVSATKPLTSNCRRPAVKSARCSTRCDSPAVAKVSSAWPARKTSAPTYGSGPFAQRTGTPSTAVRSSEGPTVLTPLQVGRIALALKPDQSRRAPTQRDAYQESQRLEILTTSPVCGAWTKRPPPM